ncbi:hypothetical protein GCM10014719_62240 [Planomonospora parontospora subsp. antibiotica]|nr:hypothetical protein GCM10014719_62240 [Planomonospora parontospora subsp. antibiotica]GII19441.1 hypothetical protein Ppa05_61670 [Planomonospora parontospora subsp. antibiotica]
MFGRAGADRALGTAARRLPFPAVRPYGRLRAVRRARFPGGAAVRRPRPAVRRAGFSGHADALDGVDPGAAPVGTFVTRE